jgi:hypothetical protein
VNEAVNEAVEQDLSIVNNCCVSFQDFFCLFVEIAGHFMDLVFLAAGGTSHAHSSAHAMYFKFSGTFSTFHGLANSAFVHE